MLSIKMSLEVVFGAEELVPGKSVSQCFSLLCSLSVSSPLPSSAIRWVACAFSPSAEGVADKVKRPVVGWVWGLLPSGKPLHEMDLALVLPCPWAFPGAPTSCERHIPALITCIPQRRVVVLQHDFGEDTVTALSAFLWKHTHTQAHGQS